jgi:hypothetical protein
MKIILLAWNLSNGAFKKRKQKTAPIEEVQALKIEKRKTILTSGSYNRISLLVTLGSHQKCIVLWKVRACLIENTNEKE